jgi:hypothetical protein
MDTTVARVAPAVLALLGDGVPRSRRAIVAALADDQHEHEEQADLAQRQRERQTEAACAGVPGEAARIATEHAGEGGQEHQRQDRGEILDDQPAHGDAAVDGVQRVAVFQRAQQDDGAGDRERQAEDEAGAQRGRDRDLAHGAGDGDLADREQVLDREVQADAEHQEDDADLGELAGQGLVARRSPA